MLAEWWSEALAFVFGLSGILLFWSRVKTIRKDIQDDATEEALWRQSVDTKNTEQDKELNELKDAIKSLKAIPSQLDILDYKVDELSKKVDK